MISWFIVFVFCTLSYAQDNDTNIELLQPESVAVKPNRSFVIDYDSNQFLMDGKPFRYVSGSIHYFRLPRVYWEDRLRKIRAAGLNAIETYVEWSQHEQTVGVYNFEGDLDIVYFIQLADQLGLKVILRPGPYICAERDLGGYPPWLFTLHPNIRLRTSDRRHTFYVQKWFKVLMPKIVPLLYGNGGPIIMVQVENEYGSYFACERPYSLWLRDLFKSYVQNNAVLFTTDGASDNDLLCGPIPDVFITIDFGADDKHVSEYFDVLKRANQTKGPLVNSEFYPGWLTHWNERYQEVSTEAVVKSLKAILDYTNYTSVNFYMFYGGTNFGFTAGADCDDTIGYNPLLTSYDYNAPITEAGDLTDKYYAIKNLLSDYDFLEAPSIEVQHSAPKVAHGKIQLRPKVSLFEVTRNIPPVYNEQPLTFEELNHPRGFMLYKTQINGQVADPSQLFVPGLRDRAIVFVNEVPVGVLSRFRNMFSIPIIIHEGQTLSLLVENEGHINYGTYMNDTKGIVCQVLLNGETLSDWEMIKIPLDTTADIESSEDKDSISPPAFYSGRFKLKQNDPYNHDTYLNLKGWGKGVAFLNGFNLGRYWVTTGSQITLYVPGNLFQPFPSYNTLTILELEHENPNQLAVFQDKPEINSTVPELGKRNTVCQMACSRSIPYHYEFIP